jgi:hypothetical protein
LVQSRYWLSRRRRCRRGGSFYHPTFLLPSLDLLVPQSICHEAAFYLRTTSIHESEGAFQAVSTNKIKIHIAIERLTGRLHQRPFCF